MGGGGERDKKRKRVRESENEKKSVWKRERNRTISCFWNDKYAGRHESLVRPGPDLEYA